CSVSATCNDSNSCTTDACVNGTCANIPVVTGTACGDNNVCNGAETCQSGICVPSAAPQCNDGNPCTADVCDPVLGGQNTPVANGTACADNTVGNGVEPCQAGACTRGTAPNCNDNNACTIDTCSPASGCVNTPIPGCTACNTNADCNDSNPCTA